MRRRSWASSRMARELGEGAFVLLVLIVAGAITTLLVPTPFRVESGRSYTGEQAVEISRVMDRRFWIGMPVLIATGLVLEFARTLLRSRLARGGATAA